MKGISYGFTLIIILASLYDDNDQDDDEEDDGDEDMKPKIIDDVDKEIPSKMTMHVTEFLTVQVAPSGGLSFQQMHMVPHV